MTREELATLLSHTRLREKSRKACELVLVEGKTQTEAARLAGTSKESVSEAIKSVRGVIAKLAASHAPQGVDAGIETRLLNAYHVNDWSTEADMPDCPLDVRICVALALGRYDLLPAPWTDPLAAYRRRLDDRQRAVVDASRRW